MMTAIVIGAFFVLSCLAAAGLIASTQNDADAARAMAGLDINQDVGV